MTTLIAESVTDPASAGIVSINSWRRKSAQVSQPCTTGRPDLDARPS